jgi:hypothetical protein
VTPDSAYGHLVVGGESIPIFGVELREGCIWFTAFRMGPFEHSGGPITVFGEDGQGVGQGGGVDPMKVGDGELLKLKVDLRFETLE